MGQIGPEIVLFVSPPSKFKKYKAVCFSSTNKFH